MASRHLAARLLDAPSASLRAGVALRLKCRGLHCLGSIRAWRQIPVRRFVMMVMVTAIVGVADRSYGEITAAEETPAMASSRISAEHLQQYSDLGVTWMQEYLRIDTTNPPGHEMRAVAFYKKILDQEGVENRVFEYAPGRGDLWARLPHATVEGKRPIILLNHMDVVTSDATHWEVPPFSGEIKDGWI